MQLPDDVGRAEIVAAGRQAIADTRAEADALVEHIAALIETATGETIAVRRPGLLDAQYGDLARMEAQARAYLEAMSVVRRWRVPGDRRTLGALLKVMPPDEAERLTAHLRAAGVLSS